MLVIWIFNFHTVMGLIIIDLGKEGAFYALTLDYFGCLPHPSSQSHHPNSSNSLIIPIENIEISEVLLCREPILRISSMLKEILAGRLRLLRAGRPGRRVADLKTLFPPQAGPCLRCDRGVEVLGMRRSTRC